MDGKRGRKLIQGSNAMNYIILRLWCIEIYKKPWAVASRAEARMQLRGLRVSKFHILTEVEL